MHTPHAAPSSSRLLFLDWLRIGAFALLVLYHVGMYYVSWEFHIKSPHAGPALEPWMRLSSPWRLSLLFLISGAATSFMLQRDGASGSLLAARSKRLLWPLLFGMAVIVPPQSYFEVMQQHSYTGSFFDFVRLYASGYGGFCKSDGHCLILPTWNHLWFVAYLFVYTLVLWVLLRLAPRALEATAAV
ncbi:MAG TPA: acyltransferase family protein, partial [Burkholderiaceae bacterium]